MAEDQAVVNAVPVSNDSSVSSSQSSAAPEVSQNVPRGTSETASAPEPEKMLPQSKVNELVGRTRQEERERMRREYESRQIAQPAAQPQQTQDPSIGGVSQLNEDRVRQLYREEAERQALGVLNNRVATDFVSKLDAAKTKYQDFEKVTEDLKIMNLPMNYVHLFNEFDNAGDMLYDLGKNPEKLGQIVPLFYDQNLARRALKKLSDSIKTNEIAVKQPQANPPLSQISPSPTGVDNGKMNVSDLRRQPWARG